LTGRPPFRGETLLATLQQVTTQEPVPPSRLQAGGPRDLETICLKCLQKEGERGYPHARALAEDMTPFLHGEPTTGRRTPHLRRASKWVSRHPVLTLLLVFGLCQVLVLYVTSGVVLPSETTNTIGMKLVRIPKGTFRMGSPGFEPGHNEDEQMHEVEIT